MRRDRAQDEVHRLTGREERGRRAPRRKEALPKRVALLYELVVLEDRGRRAGRRGRESFGDERLTGCLEVGLDVDAAVGRRHLAHHPP